VVFLDIPHKFSSFNDSVLSGPLLVQEMFGRSPPPTARTDRKNQTRNQERATLKMCEIRSRSEISQGTTGYSYFYAGTSPAPGEACSDNFPRANRGPAQRLWWLFPGAHKCRCCGSHACCWYAYLECCLELQTIAMVVALVEKGNHDKHYSAHTDRAINACSIHILHSRRNVVNMPSREARVVLPAWL